MSLCLWTGSFTLLNTQAVATRPVNLPGPELWAPTQQVHSTPWTDLHWLAVWERKSQGGSPLRPVVPLSLGMAFKSTSLELFIVSGNEVVPARSDMARIFMEVLVMLNMFC